MGIGLILPIIIFLIYLQAHNLVIFWLKLSWEVPRIYSTILFPESVGLGGLKKFASNLIASFLLLNFRWNFFFLLLSINFFILVKKILKKENYFKTPCLNFILISSILGISNTLHIPEIFRLATISSVGVITLFLFLNQYKILNIIFLLFSYTLGVTLLSLNTGNYFYPNPDLRKKAVLVNSPSYFKGQKWPLTTAQYYQNIASDLNNITSKNCGIKYHYNDSEDSFLQIISPFIQYQIAPSAQWDVFNNLRQDLNFMSKIREAKDILIFKSVSERDLDSFKIPTGFYSFSKYSRPPAVFLPPKQILLILVPLSCK